MSGLVNIFEDPSLIREGGWLKLVCEYECIPDDYGIAWYLPDRAVGVCAPMPWHTVYGWAYEAYWRWRCRRGRLSPLERAYTDGVEAERKRGADRAAFVRAQHEFEVRDAERKARLELVKELMAEIADERGKTRH